tara:strand:- start:109 stop:729 length:621 start_codon:yes stop_codon:yes gene_type:complete
MEVVMTDNNTKQEYKWSFSGVNSKGEPKFNHDVEETLDDVLEYLDSLEGVEYSLREGATMLWVDYSGERYAYYYTTGRWSPWIEEGLPSKHYRSINIKDFMERFVFSEVRNKKEYFVKNETIESVKKLLDKYKIDYEIEKDVVTITSKAIPRLDGKGYKRQYVYEYIIGKGKWRGARSGGTYRDVDPYYQARNIKSFLTDYFRDGI